MHWKVIATVRNDRSIVAMHGVQQYDIETQLALGVRHFELDVSYYAQAPNDLIAEYSASPVLCNAASPSSPCVADPLSLLRATFADRVTQQLAADFDAKRYRLCHGLGSSNLPQLQGACAALSGSDSVRCSDLGIFDLDPLSGAQSSLPWPVKRWNNF